MVLRRIRGFRQRSAKLGGSVSGAERAGTPGKLYPGPGYLVDTFYISTSY